MQQLTGLNISVEIHLEKSRFRSAGHLGALGSSRGKARPKLEELIRGEGQETPKKLPKKLPRKQKRRSN